MPVSAFSFTRYPLHFKNLHVPHDVRVFLMFVQFNLNKSINQTRGIFDTYSYRTDDSINDVTTPGYFSKSRFIGDADGSMDWRGAIIDCECSDGLYAVRVLSDGVSAEIAGQQGLIIVEVTASYNQTSKDDVIYCDSGTPFPVNLLSESDAVKKVIIKNLGAGTVTLTPDGSESTEVTSLTTTTSTTLSPRVGVGWVAV